MTQKYIENKYYIVIFESKNHAVQIYQYLNRKKYKQYTLISTPCRIKSGCSYSIKFLELEDYKLIEDICKASGMKILDLYIVERKDGKRVITKIDK